MKKYLIFSLIPFIVVSCFGVWVAISNSTSRKVASAGDVMIGSFKAITPEELEETWSKERMVTFLLQDLNRYPQWREFRSDVFLRREWIHSKCGFP